MLEKMRELVKDWSCIRKNKMKMEYLCRENLEETIVYADFVIFLNENNKKYSLDATFWLFGLSRIAITSQFVP